MIVLLLGILEGLYIKNSLRVTKASICRWSNQAGWHFGEHERMTKIRVPSALPLSISYSSRCKKTDYSGL